MSDLVGNPDDRLTCDEAHNVLGANLGLFLKEDVPVMEDLGGYTLLLFTRVYE